MGDDARVLKDSHDSECPNLKVQESLAVKDRDEQPPLVPVKIEQIAPLVPPPLVR